MNIYPQEPPFSVQIELVEGCQLRCSFCGLNGIRGKENNFKFMTRDTLASLFNQLVQHGWNPRCEFAMHGEGTMHPDYIGMIRTAYEIAPKYQLMLTTNGGGLLRDPGPVENILGLFRDSGLNILALDDYEGVKIVGKIRPHLDEICSALGIQWYEYPDNPEGNPHRRSKEPFISIIKDISISAQGTHSRLSNHTGAAASLDYSMMHARCHRPFREMSVRWDGSVAICCEDWRGKYRCGNIVTDGLMGVWHSEAFEAARRMLMDHNRDFGACAGCNQRSYRVGLLPDKKGRDVMELPDEETSEVIARVMSNKQLTESVRRPWEK